MADKDAAGSKSKYAVLPPAVRLQDTVTSEDVVAHPEVVEEAERERQWLLRTAGLL